MSDEVREAGLLLGDPRPEPARGRLLGGGAWWLIGNDTPWRADAVTVLSDRLVFRPHPVLVA